FQSVIAAFGPDVGFGDGEKLAGGFFGEDADGIDTFERRQHQSAILLVVDWTIGSFQLLNRLVPVDRDEQEVAEVARRFEVGDMAEMQDIKASIRNDEPFAARADLGPPRSQLIPG